MNNKNLFISESLQELQKFLKSSSFSRAILVGIAVSVPIVLGLQLGYFEIGLALCFGAFWSSPSDISGSFHRKKMGIIISAIMVTFITFVGGYLHYTTWITLPILGILGFGISYISVYGFRASLISFSGLLALVLSFAHDSKELEIYQYALLVGTGGLWYLLLAKIRHLLNPKAETEELLSETYALTASFIETRGKLIGPQQDRENLHASLLKLQSELTINHKTLREILILSRKSSGWSNYQDKRLLIFAQLIEMMETAIANPVNYDRMDILFGDHPQFIKIFQDLIFKMAHQLQSISKAENGKGNLPANDEIRQCFEDVKVEISLLHETLDYSEYLMLQNLLEYQEKQFEKIKRIKWLLGDTDAMEIDFIDRKAAKGFVAPQDYDPKLLLRNFSFKSTIFRHSLRLAVTIMIGYTLGSLLPFQNPYWILLTIIVIMRPSYGLTKNRAKDRIIGTLIGGALAYGLVFIVQDVYAYGIMGVASLVIAISLIQKNSKASAIFVTLSVVFIYAILSDDILTVIQFRIIDTVVGAGLSYAAMLWLWPTWESVEIKESIKRSVEVNRDFFLEIKGYYELKGSIPTSYNLARKEAFLETSNLNSAFQRMAQEPKEKQKGADSIYELVVLNHTFLASLASLSTFIQHHQTTEASKQFRIASEQIEKNLELVIQCLIGNSQDVKNLFSENESLFKAQLPVFNLIEIRNLRLDDKQTLRDLQEAHLVWDQLQWLFTLSGKMLKVAESVKLL